MFAAYCVYFAYALIVALPLLALAFAADLI